MASRKKVPLNQRKVEKPKAEQTSCSRPLSRERTAKKLHYARARNFVKAGKRYNARDFAEESRTKKVVESDDTIDPIFLLRQEINDWRIYESLTNKVKDKLTRIDNAGTATESPASISRSRQPADSSQSHDNGHHRFEAEPEAETRTAALCDEKHRTGSTRRCAAGGQTTGPGKRAVVSHVQTNSGDRSSPRVPRGNRSTPVNDRVASMKNLEDYLQPIQRKKTPVKLSESPLLSPDTAQALENAEKLVQQAEKQIIEASYDISSSPERENSIGSAKEKKADDDDDEVLHIRDIVSTRFHEANETARIFTRLSTRPLCERLPKPEVRRSRQRRYGERSINIRPEVPTISRRKLSKNAGKSIEEIRNSLSPERANRDKENSKKIPIENPSILSVEKNPCKNANRNAIFLFKVQQGPRVDIRNDFTVTNVEKVDISPQPKSALPVKGNIKTYEFRHESCRNEEIGIGDRSMEIAGNARDSPEVTEKSRDKLRKSPEAAPAPSPQGSRADLVVNKSGRSIRPERLEGLADNATTRISERNARESEENEEIRDETNFIDFLRRSASIGTQNFDEHNKNAEMLKNRVIGSLNTNDKINIFDRAVDQFFDEFKRPDREIAEIGLSTEHPKRKYEHFSPERDAIDGLSLEDLAGNERSVISSRDGIDGETEVLTDNWDTDDINLEPPNFDDLEKTLRKFEGTVDKISRGARSLEVLISQYSSETEGPERSVICSADRGSRGDNPTLFCSASIENQKIRSEVTDFFGEKSAEKSALDSRREASPVAKIGKKVEKKLSAKLVDSHPRFSTPLNSRFENFDRSRDDLSSNEFARFFVGIQRPKVNPETRLTLPITNETDFSTADNRNELIPALDIESQKKIVLDEIDRNCNFDALFIRDRRSNAENEEKNRNTDILDTCDAQEKKDPSELREFESRSVIQDSAIGGTTDRSDEISFGTKLIDERSTRKDSSRSEKSAPAMRNDEKSTEKSPSAEKLTVKNNSVESADMEKIEICDKKKTSDRNDVDKEKSVKGDEASDKNRFSTSADSSPRDRTSFDVSTVYSDDFEEPIVTAEKSKSHEKLEETKNSVKKIVSNEKELPVTVEVTNSDKNDKTLQSSSQKSIESSKLYGESKRDVNYIEKSVSISVNKSSDKNQRDTEKSVSESKKIVENDSVTKKTERNTREESDETSKDRNGATSSSASIKASDRSSPIGESQREVTKGTDTCSENYSEGEIYLASSRSYSLGEIRIFERPGRRNVDAGIETVARYNDGIRFFFNKNYVTFDSSDKAIDAPNTPTRSPGEVEETDAESIYSSRDLSSDTEHRQANKLTAQL